jgi:hypothetical protein
MLLILVNDCDLVIQRRVFCGLSLPHVVCVCKALDVLLRWILESEYHYYKILCHYQDACV